MAAIALTPAPRGMLGMSLHLRQIASTQRPSWSLPCEASSSSSSSASTLTSSVAAPLPVVPLATPSAIGSWFALPSIPSLSELLELLPPIVWASVPKKKVSHSRKSMRAANKGLKNKTNLSLCEACGSIKLTHHVCPTCYSQISRKWKREARGEIPSASSLEQSAAP